MLSIAANRTYQYRIYPTVKQIIALTMMLRDHCDLYNAARAERIAAWRHSSKTSIRFYDQCAQLKDIRATDERQRRWSAWSQQQTLRRLDRSFAAFFRRCTAGLTYGFPRFKFYDRFNTVTFDGEHGAWRESDRRVRVQGVGHIKVKLHRPTKGTVKQFSITRRGKKWYVNVICVDVPAESRQPTGAVIGLDRGVTNLLADSDDGFTPNPRHTRNAQVRLANAQRDLSRCRRGSNRRRKVVARVANLHEKVAATRKDHLHKLSRSLVDDYDVIVLEDLRIANMVRKPKLKPDPGSPGEYLPNGAAAKGGLNKAIQDAGWGMLAEMIRYKAESAGTEVMFVPPHWTSQTCHACGHVAAENRVKEAFKCLACGHSAHADTNAAKNILRLGLSLRDPSG